MTIQRMFIDLPGAGWKDISEKSFLSLTECWSLKDSGYFKTGTALQALKDQGQIKTPFSIFRIKPETEV